MQAVLRTFREEETAGVICRQPPPTALEVYVSVSLPALRGEAEPSVRIPITALRMIMGTAMPPSSASLGRVTTITRVVSVTPGEQPLALPAAPELRFYVPMPLDQGRLHQSIGF